MTTITAGIRPRAAVRGLALSTHALPIAALTLLLGGLLFAVWGTWCDLGRDTGYDLVAGSRVAHGELPYVNFLYYYGPLAPLTLGLAGWIGGGGLAPAVGLGIALTAGIVLATYWLAHDLVGRTGAFLAAAITLAVAIVPSNLSFVLPHAESETIGILALLLALIGLQRGGTRMLLLAGVLGGLVALTRIELELAFLAAAAAWALVHRGNRARDLALVAAPAALVPAAVYGAFLTAVPAHRLFLENLYPVDVLHAAGNAVLRLHAPLTAGSFVTLGGKCVLYAAGIAAMVLAARGLAGRRTQKPLLVALGAFAIALAAVGLARPESLRYWLDDAFAWIPAGAVVLLVLSLRRRDAAVAAPMAALAALAATTYAVFLMHANHPQPAVYAAPLAALFLARLHLVELARAGTWMRPLGIAWLAVLAVAGTGLALKDAHAQSATVHGPGGSLAVAPADAGTYRAALAAIAARTQPREPILLAPQLSALYTLSDRTDPLKEISLLPGALPTQSSEQAAIARLEAAHVRLVITDRHLFTEYGHSSFGVSFDRVLGGWIKLNFKHTATFGSVGESHILDVWTRRTP